MSAGLDRLPAGLPRSAGGDRAASSTPGADQWIVELDAAPLARYRGGIRGMEATAPERTGRRVDRDSSAARAYEGYLDDRQTAALRAVPGVKPVVDYRAALAGFAARLTAEQVEQLRRAEGVRRVIRERFLEVLAAPGAAAGGSLAGSEPELLGLPDGLWKRLGGPKRAGRGVIVGVVDTGITPEAASFADRGLEPPASWDGACQAGEEFPVSSCNDKLIGARYFLDGAGDDLPDGAFHSPRDEIGHGTHVAAIAAGNHGVDPSIGGDDLGVDRISGVAPAAYLAAYKACWAFPGAVGLCSDVDVVAAIDAAVADGVDVINLSLGGFPAPKMDPVQLAALNADAAGVVVVTAAGNLGEHYDAAGSISSPAVAPWTLAVGATTGQRVFRSSLRAESMDGTVAEVSARMAGPALPSGQLVDGGSVRLPGRDPFEEYDCLDVDPAQVRGKVVICDFPGDFLILSPPERILDAVKRAGALGIVLSWRDDDPPIFTWSLPTALVTPAEAADLRRVTASGETSVTATPGRGVARAADEMAAFSSRGPVVFTTFGAGGQVEFDPVELLRPDVVAPGVETLSAYAPRTYFGHLGWASSERYAALSGTSMASPMAAGTAALLTQIRPQWSPAAIRSAVLTSARAMVVDTGGDRTAGPDDAGGGRIDPTAAADADLVIEPTTEEYRRYAEGLDPDAFDGDLEPIAPRDLNVPSLALHPTTSPQETSRTFTNAGSSRATWTIEQYTAPEGDAFVTSNPVRFTLSPGQRRAVRFQIYVARGTPELRSLALTMRNQTTGRVTRLPIAARNPGLIESPAKVTVDDAPREGEHNIEATISGDVSAVGHGLARPEVHSNLTTPGGASNAHWRPLRLESDVETLIVEGVPNDSEAKLNVSVYDDRDRNGRPSSSDRFLFDRAVAGLPSAEFALGDLRAGHYLIAISSRDTAPIPFHLRIWKINDPRPDDPEPSPGLVADGDPIIGQPSTKAVTLRWNGADGDHPLRGILQWHAGPEPTEDNRLGSTVIEIGPSAPR